MADYTFFSLIEPLKNNSSIQTVLDIDALAAPAKSALASYVASLGLPAAETQHLTWENIGVAVMVRTLALTYYLPSLGTQTPAPDLRRTATTRDRVIEMQTLESGFPKCQILIWGKDAGESNWKWLNTEVIQNSGNRVNTLKLLPYIAQVAEFSPGRGTQIGLQFILDPAFNVTLPQTGDRLTVQGSVWLDVNPIGGEAKKNDGDSALESRLAALEVLLQPFGAATATAAGTTGLVAGAALGQPDYMLRGDRTWQDPAEFVSTSKNQTVNGNKTFSQILIGLKELVATGVGSLSNFSSRTAVTLFSTGAGAYLSMSASNAPVNSKTVDLELNSLGTLTLRRINDAYNAVLFNVFLVDVDGSFRVFGFTFLGGNVAIKEKEVSGVTPATQGYEVRIPHGVDAAKIRRCSLTVNISPSQWLGTSYLNAAGYELSWQFDATDIVIYAKAGNSENILSKPFTVLITYRN